ncbi:MAG: hypothetical protein HRU75_08035 [Planctomycetia bacterium]|nr:MAG: hypothetical protein HRU75_08035 [Planctomycetia bacterium]
MLGPSMLYLGGPAGAICAGIALAGREQRVLAVLALILGICTTGAAGAVYAGWIDLGAAPACPA